MGGDGTGDASGEGGRDETVDTFRARIKEKLGLKNMTQLIQRACQWVAEAKQ